MALQPQVVEVPFEGGVDTKTDRKKVIPGKLLALENAVFDGQEIRSRPGAAYLPNGKVTGGSLTTANALAVVGGELLRWDDSGVYGYANASAAPWVQRGDAVDAAPLQYEVEAIAQRARSCETFDSATLLGITAYIWTEAGDGARSLRLTVVDDVTGIRHQDAVEVFGDLTGSDAWRVQARVIACGGNLLVFYGTTTGNLFVRKVLPSNPSVLQAAQFVGHATPDYARAYPYEFDVADVTSGTATASTVGMFLIVYGQAAGVRLEWWTADPTSGTGYAVNGVDRTQVPTTGGAATDCIAMTIKATADRQRFYLLFTNRVSLRLELHTYEASGRTLVASTNLGPSVAAGMKVATLERTANITTAYLEEIGTTSPLGFLQWGVDGAVTIPMDMLWMRALRLAGQAFAMGGRYYLPVFHVQRGVTDAPGLQPTLFLLDIPEDNNTDGRVVLRALAGEAGGPLSGTWLLPHSPVMAGEAPLLIPRRTRVEFDADSGAVSDVSSVGLVRMDVTAAPPGDLREVEISRALHVGGAAPALYDAGTWAEEGFHLQPEGVEVAVGVGGALSAGTYSWVACYEWMDAQGRLHRSAPSIPVSATVPAGAYVMLDVPYLHLTRKREVRIAVYRTTANGTVFYRAATSRDSYVQPEVITGDAVGIREEAADATIQDNEILPYGGAQGGSIGGELWHRPPPGYRYIHKHQSYLFAVPMDDPYTIRYTLPLTDGEGPAWADELVLQVPSAHGKAVALATIDDKLIIICERGAYVVYGQGPLRNGADNGLTEPMYITGSVGCADAGSVCETPDGLMWAATSGLHLLSRGLETVKLGAAVDLYADSRAAPSFSRAIQMPATKELRWYQETGRTLVYSSEWSQWGTWTNQPTKDAVIFGDVVHYADGTGVRVEMPFLATEVGNPIVVAAETAWLKWSGMQGLQRVWKAYLLFSSEATVNVTSAVYVDYDDTAPVQVLGETFPGSEEGGRPTMRLRQTMKKQLCTALRFRWEFTRESTTGLLGGTVALSSLTLEFGVQKAPSKRKVLKFNGG